jgi:succinylglutamate desuccinylase
VAQHKDFSGEIVNHVLVSGGTHGNEFTGAFLARQWLADSQPLIRSGFKTHVLLANPEAFKICKRYVERDLNRSFDPSDEISNPNAFELRRAAEIQYWLMARCDGGFPDAIFDLHSTTASMGLSLVLTNLDRFNLMNLAYLRQRFENVNAYLWEEPLSRPGFLNGLTHKGFAIEVGPVANGVLSAEWVLKTSQLVNACLDFIALWNAGTLPSLPESVPLYRFRCHIDYPRSADSLPAAMIHPEFQNRNFGWLQTGDPVFMGFDGKTIVWEGSPGWAVFINEAAYYEKGIAFTLTDKIDAKIE